MKELLLIIDGQQVERLAPIRTIGGAQVALIQHDIYIRGIAPAEQKNPKLLALPIKTIGLMDEQGSIFKLNELTPFAKLPEVEWVPLTSFLKVEIPSSPLAAIVENEISIHLKPSGIQEEPIAIMTDLATFASYAENISNVRLSSLKFAMSNIGEVFIIGKPMLPLPGQVFWQKRSIFIPVGHDLEWGLFVDEIEEKLNPEKLDLIVFYKNNQFEKINKNYFQQGSRGAVKKSILNLQNSNGG